MNTSIDEIMEAVPLLKNSSAICEVMSGGLSNTTYKVIVKNDQYVVRINGAQNKYLVLTRSSEVDVMNSANQQGLAPKVVDRTDAERYIMTAFIEGRMVTDEDLQDNRIQRLIINQLKQVHNMQDHGRQCSPHHLIFSYLKGAEQLGVQFPDGLAPLLHRVEEISHKRSSDKRYNHRFCHNDFFACNLIYTKPQLQIIDWELSGSGDVFFDLATIPFSSSMSTEQEKEWLALYFGFYEDELFMTLQDMKFMSMVRTCAWGIFFSGLDSSRTNPFDYYGHSLRMIERMQAGVYHL